MKEIERKFLVDSSVWAQQILPQPMHLVQGYLHRGDSHVVRVRVKENHGFITVKGANTGSVRDEFEYKIPHSEALFMLEHYCPKRIEKFRYQISHSGHIWEVDQFVFPKAGLLLAEIELQESDETFDLPEWVLDEVTHLPEYFNSNMI